MRVDARDFATFLGEVCGAVDPVASSSRASTRPKVKDAGPTGTRVPSRRPLPAVEPPDLARFGRPRSRSTPTGAQPDGRRHVSQDVNPVGVDVLASLLVPLPPRAPRRVELYVPAPGDAQPRHRDTRLRLPGWRRRRAQRSSCAARRPACPPPRPNGVADETVRIKAPRPQPTPPQRRTSIHLRGRRPGETGHHPRPEGSRRLLNSTAT